MQLLFSLDMFCYICRVKLCLNYQKVSTVSWELPLEGRSELELKSNSNEILRINCKFICDYIPT